jgi:hypothetical protein
VLAWVQSEVWNKVSRYDSGCVEMERAAVKCNGETSRRQRGAGRLKAIIYTAVLIGGIYAAYKIVPPYVAEYQLKDKMVEQARFAVVNRYEDKQIRDNIMATINDLDIPAKPEDVKVLHTGSGVAITVNYSVPVDFIVYKTELNFSPTSEGRDLMK